MLIWLFVLAELLLGVGVVALSHRGFRDGRGLATALLAQRPPLKTGTHTYATWSSGPPDDDDDDDVEVGRPSRRRPAQRRRPEWSSEEAEEYEEEDGRDERGQSDSSRSMDRNPVVEWLRKVYDAVFFYGLDSQIPPRWSRRGDGAGRKVVKSGKKSMFFTSMEQIGQNILEKGYDPFAEGSKLPSQNQPGVRVASRRNQAAQNAVGAGAGAEYGGGDDKAATILRRMKVLDDCIISSKNELKNLAESEVDETEKVRIMKKIQSLDEGIEAMQVQYVALSVELNENSSR